MAAPLAGVTSATQIAQQKIQDQGLQQGPKAGASKFDNVMANQGAGKAQGVDRAAQVQQPQRTEHTQQVSQTAKADKAVIHKNVPSSPVAAKAEASKMGDMIAKMVGDMEKGQGVMDKLVKAGMSGKQFSNAELISMQAGMYKYAHELDLTSKVVEKATSGLKDTLKTQV